MSIIDSIKDRLGNIIYPKTVIKAVYDDATSVRLDVILEDKVVKEISKSLVLDTEIAKIHESGSDNQDLSGLVVKVIGSSLVADTEIANISGLMPKSGGILENYTEKIVVTTGGINLSLGNVFTQTLSANTTYSITNAISGKAHSFTLIITQPSTAVTLTFPASVKWQGGEIPDMTTISKTYVLTFVTINGGTTWLGMFGGEF